VTVPKTMTVSTAPSYEFANGWNECVATMLAAPPHPPQAEAQQLPMTEREMYNVFVHVCDDGSAPSFADFLTEVELIKYTRAIETWIKGKN